MDGTNIRFSDHARVRLRTNVDPAVYGDFACVGQEGWIAEQDTDHFGLPKVLIKWDHNHWAYNGAPDCWTFAEHFEEINEKDEPMADNKRDLLQRLALDFASNLANVLTDEPDKKETTDTTQPASGSDLITRIGQMGRVFAREEPNNDPYDQAVAVATERLRTAEGFIVIGVDNDGDLYEPFALAFSKDPKSELAIQAHLAGITASAHQDLVIKALNDLRS